LELYEYSKEKLINPIEFPPEYNEKVNEIIEAIKKKNEKGSHFREKAKKKEVVLFC